MIVVFNDEERVVHDSPARKRTVLTWSALSDHPRVVRCGRLAILSLPPTFGTYYTLYAFHVADDGLPLRPETAARVTTGRHASSGAGRICMGTVPNGIVRDDPVGAFWMSRFEVIRWLAPRPTHPHTLGSLIEQLGVRVRVVG